MVIHGDVYQWEIRHNQEGVNQLKSQLCKETTEVVFEATGVYSRQVETFLKIEHISYCILNLLLAKKQTDGLRGNKTNKVDAHKLAQSHYRFDREKRSIRPQSTRRYMKYLFCMMRFTLA